MKLTCSKSGAASVIKVEDRMDAQSCPDFEKECQRLIQEGEKQLVVDLGALRYISSAGLRAFLVVGNRLKETGGSLRICCLDGLVKQVFLAAGFTSIFPIFDSVDAATK
ncbi:MAG: STAS domain-containing protein [Verrucomicrobia bacterium]|nr:STAS domain-containing protein [Verrucomicrobiota bacterium]